MSYNNFVSNSNSDYHLFSNSDQNVMVSVRIGDVIVVCGNIKSWKIVKNKGGTYWNAPRLVDHNKKDIMV